MALVPIGVVTVTSTVPTISGGDTAVSDVDEFLVKLVASVEPNLTDDTWLNSVPLIVTGLPPVTGPDTGWLIFVTVGGLAGPVASAVLVPASMAVAPVTLLTGTGEGLPFFVPSPSCPTLFSPQVCTEPLPRSAMLKPPPDEMAMTLLNPPTGEGLATPFPSTVPPHSSTVPSLISASA